MGAEVISIATGQKIGTLTQQFCGFVINGDLFAIPVLDVQEVIKPQKVTAVPLSDPCIKGLINLRGQIVTLVDLRRMFNLPEREGEEYMNVIVKTDDGLTALKVDEICDVMDLSADSFEETPDTLAPELAKYLAGVYKLEDRLCVVLDLKKVLSFLNNE